MSSETTAPSLTGDERHYYTLVIRGDIRQLPCSPFKIAIPGGEVVACGYGHAYREIDRLEDQLSAAGVDQ